MELIETLVVVSHVLFAVAVIVLILLQHGKGADAGAAFGAGASQTVFGSQGSATFLSKMTAILAVLFFVTSFSLAVFAKQRAQMVSDPYAVAPAEQSAAPVQSGAGEKPSLDADNVGSGANPELESGAKPDLE